MPEFSKADKKHIDTIKKNVEDAEKYFSDNKKRFRSDKVFAFKSTITPEDKNALSASGYPQLDINVIEPYISKYCGNFYKQSPEVEVTSENLQTNPDQIEMIEGIMRAIFFGSNYKHSAPEVVKDQLCGFGVWEVSEKYKHEKSFDKVITLEYGNPIMCGFDPMATGVTKEDAKFYYKLYPMTKLELEEEYPDLNLDRIDKMPLKSGSDVFSWRHKVNENDVYYIADYYEKKKKKVMYYNIADPENPRKTKAITEKEYKEIYENPDNPLNPEILQKQNKLITKIKRYKIIGQELLEAPEKMQGSHNRLIFVDGNSVSINDDQYTRSYFHNVKDSQRIKNRCISSSMYELMTLRKSDIFMAEESLPTSKSNKDAYKDVERAKGALMYKAFKKDGTPLPGPSVQPRGQMNQQTMQLFEMSDKTIQSQFGTYDAQLGIQKNNISGKAITEGAMQSSDVSMPFVINYMASLKQVAIVILDLMPLYYTTMRTMPVISVDGCKEYITINDTNNPQTMIDYDVNDLGVEVEAGPSFDVQRRDSLQALYQAMQASSSLQEILNSSGLSVLVKNIDIKERQALLKLVEEFSEKKKEQAKSHQDPQMIQMQAMQSEEKRKDAMVQIKQQEVGIKAKKNQQDYQIDVEKLRQSGEKLEEELMEIKATMLLRMQNAQNEQERTQAMTYLKQIDLIMSQEKHQMDIINSMKGDN